MFFGARQYLSGPQMTNDTTTSCQGRAAKLRRDGRGQAAEGGAAVLWSGERPRDFVSLFDCCVFSTSLSLLTNARPQRKKRGGMHSPVPKRVATATRDGTGRQRVRLLLFFVLLSLLRCGWRQQRGTRRGVTGAYSVVF